MCLATSGRSSCPHDETLGASTLNIGVLRGGRAPNVIADEAAAEIMIRLVEDGDSTDAAVRAAADGRADVREVLRIPAVHLGPLEGFETCVVSFATDIPAFGSDWGEPFLIGPGTIHDAHTADERVSKKEMTEAVTIYQNMVKQFLARA